MRILIIRWSSLGDIILTQPVVAILREEYPDAEIHYCCKPAMIPLVECFTGVNRVISTDNLDRSIHYDIAIDLQAKPGSIVQLKRLSADRRVIYNKRRLTRWLIVKHLTSRSIDSTLDLYFSALNKLGIEAPLRDPVITPKTAHEAFINEIFIEHNVTPAKTLIGIAPGARHYTKRYPMEYWIRFIDSIPDSWNCQFILIGSTEDREICAEIHRQCPNTTFDLCARTSTDQLVNLMDRIGCLISGDSGPMHVAAALGKPQIAIFGGTNTRLGFRPLNSKAVILEQDLKCRPCSLHGRKTCPKSHFRCMKTITPSVLHTTFKEVLEEKVWRL